MKPVKCDNCKKFYDEDKYKICPHCKSDTDVHSYSTPKKETPASEVKEPVSEPKESLRHKLFSRRNKNESDQSASSTPEVSEQVYEDISSHSSSPVSNNSSEEKENVKAENPAEDLPEMKQENFEEKKETKSADNINRELNFAESIDEINTEKSTEENEEEEFAESNETVNSDDNTDKTSGSAAMPIAEAVRQADAIQSLADQKTIAFYNFSNDIEPVVGWLVCIRGEYHGTSFNLKSGRNYIGRALTMDVALAQEKSVSRERHASITFDPQQKKFFVQSGESRGLTYVNDELLMTFKELNAYDVISLGACKLMFLPLCGEKFDWDNNIY